MMASVKRELMDGSDGSDGEPKLEIADHPVDSDPPSNQDAVESEYIIFRSSHFSVFGHFCQQSYENIT